MTENAAQWPDDAVHVEGLDVRYRGTRLPALRQAHLRAPSGRVTALVGTNGAGKTTLLRTIIGAHQPSAGSIELLGYPMGGAEQPLPLGVGFVPDQPMVPGLWTAADDVARWYKRMVPGFDRDRMLALLSDFGVPSTKAIDKLSAGQKTLFSVATALASAPQLLILDEPMARLDPLARPELLDALRTHLARDDARSILVSTHDLEGMERFADHLVALHSGTTVLEGDVDTLCEGHMIATIPESDVAADQRELLIGPRALGGDQEALVEIEDAAALPPGAAVREAELRDIVTFTLRQAAARGHVSDEAVA